MSETINQLKAQINALQARVDAYENGVKEKNLIPLATEIANLIDGVGKGYVVGDYYAPTRYYSEIPGVKNLRMASYGPDEEEVKSFQTRYPQVAVTPNEFGKIPVVLVKVTSPKGELLPEYVTVKGLTHLIELTFSDKYSSEVDY